MIVTCDTCHHVYDDFDHWTNCPHAYFPMRTLAVRPDGTKKICTSLEELDQFLSHPEGESA